MNGMIDNVWYADGNLIFSLNDGVNYNEIRVTQWNGSRCAPDLEEGARLVFDLLDITGIEPPESEE